MFLAKNADQIGARGYDLAYPGRDDIPGGRLRLRLPGPGTGAERRQGLQEFLDEQFTAFSPDPNRALILSEENIPGVMRHFYKGAFFPGIRRRLKFLKEALPGRVDRLVYVVRSYDELFVSAYRKFAEDNAAPPFESYRDTFMGITAGWPHVISALRDVFDQAEVVVVAYKNRGSSIDLFRHLVPALGDTAWDEPERLVNLSATDAALVALQDIYARGEALNRAEWQKVIANHADQRGWLGFAEFSEADRTQLQDRYAADLDDLNAMPGISFIK
jgi:hypothetical protein